MNGMIHWFAKNHVAANFLMVFVLIMGFSTWFKIRKEIFPETGIDMIAIQVPYPNAAPEEVSTGICVPIEEAIDDLDGIERVSSTATESMGVVLVEVATGYDVRDLMSDVKARVDAIDNFAENAEEPNIEELLLKSQVLSVAVSAEADDKTLRLIAQRVRDQLAAQPEITQVALAGIKNYEISIEVSEHTLRQYGITFDQVADAVRASSLDLPAGSVDTDAGVLLRRTANKR